MWRALTDPDVLAGWLMRPVGFAATIGTQFEFRTDTARGVATRVDLSHSGFDGFDVLIARAVLGLGWRRLLVRQLRAALDAMAYTT